MKITLIKLLLIFCSINFSSIPALCMRPATGSLPGLPVDGEEHTSRRTNSIKAEVLFRDFEVPQDQVILDIGCGNGEVTSQICSLTNALRVIGSDPDGSKIRNARETHGCNLKLEFREESAEDLFETEMYGVVTCLLTLHWLSEEHTRAALSNISRSLKPSGIFVATFVVESERPRLNTAIQEIRIQERWRDFFREYTDPIRMVKATATKDLLRENGFTIHSFDYDETTREFNNDQIFLAWINKWSTYRKYFPSKDQHDNFWQDIIHRYRQLTQQIESPTIVLTEYYARVYATK